MTSQRSNGIYKQERFILFRHFRCFSKGLQDTCRSFGVDQTDDFYILLGFNRSFKRLRFYYLSPVGIHADDLRAGPGSEFHHSLAEETTHSDNGGISRLQEIIKARFHTCRPCTGDRESQLILSAEYFTEHCYRVFHNGNEIRVKVTQHRCAHSHLHTRVYITGTGTH